MKTTLSNTKSMQNSTGFDAFVAPPTSFTSQVCERSNAGNKAGDRALASLWIRRLKPREEPESLKGEIFASGIETWPGLRPGNSDFSRSMVPCGSQLQQTFSTKTSANKALSKTDEERVLKDALNEQISSSEKNDYGGERQQNSLKQGQGRIITLAGTPYTSGFGQQINQITDERKLPTKLMTVDMNVNSRYTSEAAVILHTYNRAAENRCQVSHTVRVQAAEGGIPASSLGKPPLPPSHNKSGFPPRPAGHKSPSFSAWSAGKVSSSLTNHKLVALQDIARHPSHIAAMKESLLATNASPGSPLKEGRHLKPLECFVESSQADEPMEAAATSASATTANFPWEMFAGAAGPSRSAREEFVEVYNRARNELKNHKFSSSITKVFHKEMENHPRFVSGHAPCIRDTSIIKREGETSGPEKLSKAEGVDNGSQPGEVKVGAHVSYKGLLSEKHNCGSFPEGDVDMNLRKTSQAFHRVYVTCGKESSLLMGGQSDGPLQACVKPPAVAHNDCSLTVEKSTQCRQGFARRAMSEQAASTYRELSQARLKDETDGVSHDNSKRQPGMFDSSPVNKKKTLMVLSKRQLGMLDGSPSERLPRKSDVWLQRWYPPYIPSMKGSQEHKIPESGRFGQDLAGGSVGNVRTANEGDERRASAKEDLKKRLIEKGILFQRIMTGEPKHLKTSSEKALPSAAAMAIVGTAAKQLCTVQPQHNGSFALWSGFGMPASQTREHITENGKRKLTIEVDPSVQR